MICPEGKGKEGPGQSLSHVLGSIFISEAAWLRGLPPFHNVPAESARANRLQLLSLTASRSPDQSNSLFLSISSCAR